MNDLMAFSFKFESPQFCDAVIGSSSSSVEVQLKKFDGLRYLVDDLDLSSYSSLLNTVMKGCLAAGKGEVEKLRGLNFTANIFDLADYDKRTPLHYAVRANQVLAVRYLIEIGVDVNRKDRWQATPLDYAKAGTEIEDLLLSSGSVRG